MSFFKPTLKERKQRLLNQAEAIKHKMEHTTNPQQKLALVFKWQEKINQANNVLRDYLTGGLR